MSSHPKHLYEFGPFVLDPVERTLLRNGQRVRLRPKVFDMLLVLVENSGRLVEKEELMRAVWKEQFVEEGNLNKNVSMLRDALGESPATPKYIETEPKRGYRFVAEVRAVNGGESELVIHTRTRTSFVVEEETDDTAQTPVGADTNRVKPAAKTAVVLGNLAAKSARSLKSKVALAAAASIVVFVAAAYFFYPRASGEAIDSIAVLPFFNDSGDPDVEYLSDGLTESLINSISQLPNVKVIGRSSSFKFKGKGVDPQEVSRALGVKAILTGHVTRRGKNLIVSVELMNARDRTQIWGESFNHEVQDVLAVQSDISREIAGKLRLRLPGAEQRQLAKRDTVNPQAYELLLKGRFYRSKKGTENYKRALEYFQQAVAADPAYALAYTELADSYESMVNTNLADPKEYLPKAADAARRALQLDDGLPEAHLAMSGVSSDGWDWPAAEREIKRAIELNPNLAGAHMGYTYFLIIQGRYNEALVEAKRARELDPLSVDANQVLVFGLELANLHNQAFETARKMLELDQNNPGLHYLLGDLYSKQKQFQEAIAEYQKCITLGDKSPDMQVALGQVYAEAGQREQARAILKRLETGKEYISPVGLAILYTALGEREQALTLLERAYSARDQQLVWIGVERNFAFATLSADPRFQDLMRRVGLTS